MRVGRCLQSAGFLWKQYLMPFYISNKKSPSSFLFYFICPFKDVVVACFHAHIREEGMVFAN